MRIRYLEGKDMSLAEVSKITCSGSMLICQLTARNSEGKPEIVVRPLPSQELCEQFYREVICCAGPDDIINLENTNFDTRLGEMLDEYDSLFGDDTP